VADHVLLLLGRADGDLDGVSLQDGDRVVDAMGLARDAIRDVGRDVGERECAVHGVLLAVDGDGLPERVVRSGPEVQRDRRTGPLAAGRSCGCEAAGGGEDGSGNDVEVHLGGCRKLKTNYW